MLTGESKWIHMEDPDPDEEGFEFTLAVVDRECALDVIDIAVERGAYRAAHPLREHDRP